MMEEKKIDNLELYNSHRAVPDNAKKTIKGGRMSGMTDISPMWRIKALTELFGAIGEGWRYTIDRLWTEECNGERPAFAQISLLYKRDGKWSEPVIGIGGSMMIVKEKAGLRVSDECYKMAITDAISVCCKQLGIGADVYWQGDATKYTQQEPTKKEMQTPNMRQGLRIGCQKYGIDESKIAAICNCKSIDDLTDAQIQVLTNKWEAIKKDERYRKTA